ncbi:hypothetical protein APL35_gp155 [Apis mellifera filamentous virus]|uniref:hypothetical protein n=1 Tax=Apis mellifera filamentous virus TaxID=1100043 RepID=UPI0006BCE879|nr:hypothetical protein APL35_gp155 [Apis mellifera filamentous virus]
MRLTRTTRTAVKTTTFPSSTTTLKTNKTNNRPTRREIEKTAPHARRWTNHTPFPTSKPSTHVHTLDPLYTPHTPPDVQDAIKE